jgi:hypothetical protein
MDMTAGACRPWAINWTSPRGGRLDDELAEQHWDTLEAAGLVSKTYERKRAELLEASVLQNAEQIASLRTELASVRAELSAIAAAVSDPRRRLETKMDAFIERLGGSVSDSSLSDEDLLTIFGVDAARDE